MDCKYCGKQTELAGRIGSINKYCCQNCHGQCSVFYICGSNGHYHIELINHNDKPWHEDHFIMVIDGEKIRVLDFQKFVGDGFCMPSVKEITPETAVDFYKQIKNLGSFL